eukprot:1342572-Pleurochrysis_carterae.AAC.1
MLTSKLGVGFSVRVRSGCGTRVDGETARLVGAACAPQRDGSGACGSKSGAEPSCCRQLSGGLIRPMSSI